MKTIDFSLDAAKNGGKVTAFRYSHGLSELVGSWSASVAGGTFKAGSSISFDGVMENGFITKAYKDYEGLWHIEGRDAGVQLMKSTPDISDLPKGDAKTVIQALADECGVTLVMRSKGLEGFNVRSIISGSTCAEAILELAMFSGLIAYIDNNGRLVVEVPSQNTPNFEDIIDDSGSDIDLDGYATQVLVTLNRRKYTEDEEEGELIYLGETPSTQPQNAIKSGSFSNGSYSITTLEPFRIISEAKTTITENDVTITTEEKHNYDFKSKVLWRGDQEYVLFAFIETGYSLTREAKGRYHGVLQYSTGNGTQVTSISPTFSETTTETMTRSMGNSDAIIGIPDDWQGEVKLVSSETITRSTARTGDISPSENMPDYAPPFDSQLTRSFAREDRGKALLCNETELTYEARQIGSIAPVKLNGENIPHFLQGTNLAIQTHSTPQWVQIKTSRTYFEQFDDEGQCIVSARSEYSDDGADWIVQNGLSDTGDSTLNAYEAAYAAFSQNAKGLSVSFGSSSISSQWQFLELQGRRKVMSTDTEIQEALGDISDWYDNGQYIRQTVCPHYNSYTKSCNVYALNNPSSTKCNRSKGTIQWVWCERALKALELARKQDTSQLEAPIIASASKPASSGNVGYRRDIYIDDKLKDNEAQQIANNIANNIIIVKGSKGLRKTVTIPYDKDHRYMPNGCILEVSHDWENLTTSVTYREEGDIPDCLISQTVASIAAFVSARENAKLNAPKYGVVVKIQEEKTSGDDTSEEQALEKGDILVKIDDSEVTCTSKLTNIVKDDIVLISFPAGNKLRGQVIARL